MTTPKAILTGFSLVALAIASLPYSGQIISPAFAADRVMKVQICGEYDRCAGVSLGRLKVTEEY